MKAKAYLNQIRLVDIKINQKMKECSDLKMLATCSGGFDYSAERVMTSPSGDGLLNKVARYIDLQSEIDDEIDRFVDLKHRIIAEIHELDDQNFIEILFKRYVEYKRLELIAVEMCLSYDRVRHMHGEALIEFEEKILKVSTQ